LPDGVCPAEEPRRFLLAVGVNGECGEALEGVGGEAVCPRAGDCCERLVGAAVGLLGLPLGDRNAGARRLLIEYSRHLPLARVN
jgi:hypothetical protein